MGKGIVFLRLIRVVNCLIAAAGVCVGAWLTGFSIQYYEIIITAIATFCICAAGNVMNDLIDMPIDRVSHPDRVLVRGLVSQNLAKAVTVLFAVVALCLAFTVNWAVVTLAITAALLLVFYNLYLKNLPFVGNLVVALLAGLTLVTGAAAVDPAVEFSLPNPLLPAWFAFLIHLMREIVKDIEDREGDALVKARTAPIVFGVAKSLNIVNVTLVLLILSTLLPVLIGWYSGFWYLALVLFLVDLPLVLLVVSCRKQPSNVHVHRLSQGLKLAMVAGMLALLVT
jgi:4-hydroxybenzoate polyprenyltransferase